MYGTRWRRAIRAHNGVLILSTCGDLNWDDDGQTWFYHCGNEVRYYVTILCKSSATRWIQHWRYKRWLNIRTNVWLTNPVTRCSQRRWIQWRVGILNAYCPPVCVCVCIYTHLKNKMDNAIADTATVILLYRGKLYHELKTVTSSSICVPTRQPSSLDAWTTGTDELSAVFEGVGPVSRSTLITTLRAQDSGRRTTVQLFENFASWRRTRRVHDENPVRTYIIIWGCTLVRKRVRMYTRSVHRKHVWRETTCVRASKHLLPGYAAAPSAKTYNVTIHHKWCVYISHFDVRGRIICRRIEHYRIVY